MALNERWHEEIGISSLPNEIRHHTRYDDRDYWLEVARRTFDYSRIGLWFEDGTVDYWSHEGMEWVLDN